jgi:putative membrane protein
MKGLILRWLMLAVAIIVASYLISGIRVDGFWAAFFAAAILGTLNVFFRPVLLLLTLPLNILSFGLFTFVINALMLKMASGVISGFHVDGFWPAVFGSLVISVVNWALVSFVNDQGRVEYRDVGVIDLEKKDGGGHRWE